MTWLEYEHNDMFAKCNYVNGIDCYYWFFVSLAKIELMGIMISAALIFGC